VVKILQGSVVT